VNETPTVTSVDGSHAPIAVFAYNRPEHLRRTLRSLKSCDGFSDSLVTVFCDGARTENDVSAVEAARAVAQAELGERADIRLAPRNKGLANSIIGGVSELTERHGRVIVIEDDFDLAPGFLRFMNAGLARYEDEPRVFQVSGHMFDVPEFTTRDTALFLPIITTWGWGTWQRAWRQFDPQASGWEALLGDRALRHRFNFGGVYDYAAMLRRQMSGRGDSWGIRWYWTVFRANGMTVFPPRSLVHNTGFDGSGTHGGGRFRRFGTGGLPPERGPIRLPDGPSANAHDDERVLHLARRALWRQNGGWVGRMVDTAKRLLR
jgi:hypothetical protein